MTYALADRVLETSTTQGTGTLSLAGAKTGYQSFVDGVGDGNTCAYTIKDGTNWETGIGTVTAGSPDTLSRDTILSSSNSDAAVDWGTGTRDVYIAPLAGDVLSKRRAETITGIYSFSAIQKLAKGADVASAGTLTLGDDGNYFDITGTTAITSIATKGAGTIVRLHFDDALTLTHHATDLILPGGANITTAAGDEAEFIEYASGDWRCLNYQRASKANERTDLDVYSKAEARAAAQVVKTTIVEYTTHTSITATTIPFDDTIPQNTEGTEIINSTYTMIDSSNKIRVRFVCAGAHSTGMAVVAALFRDSVADALSSAAVTGTAGGFSNLEVPPVEITPAAASIDLKIRMGVSAGTYYLNGNASNRLFGGVQKAVMVIEEIRP